MNADSATLPLQISILVLMALLDRVGERQRQDFGHSASDVKADGSLITACDRWSDTTLVQGLGRLFPWGGSAQ
jgi:myo-inositol-1(or 4)-monophosphatase